MLEFSGGGAVVGAVAFVAKNDGGGGCGLDGGVPGRDGGVVAVSFGFDAVVDARVAKAVGFSDCGPEGGDGVEGGFEGGDVETGTVLGGGEEGAVLYL